MLFTLRKVKLCRNSESWSATAPGGNEGHLGKRELVRIAILTVDYHQAGSVKREIEIRSEERKETAPWSLSCERRGGESYRSRRSTAN